MSLLNNLKKLLLKTKFKVIEKQQIKILYPYLVDYVDIILYCNNYFLCIKDFWTYNNITTNTILKYITSTKIINNNSNIKFYFILLIKDFIKINYENTNYIYIIKENNYIKLFDELNQLLYKNNLYYYDEDTIIMLY